MTDSVWTPREQAIRIADALAVAILYLMASPPRLSLARGALKAANEPTAPRWDDL